MNPQSPGTGGQRPYDSWGRPQGAPQQPGPQQPGPDYVYEVPEDFQERQQGNVGGKAGERSQGTGATPGASGTGSWSAGPSGSPIPGMSAKDFQKMCRSVDKAFSQFARIVDQGVSEVAESLGQSPEKNLKAHKELQEKRKRERQAQQWAPLAKAKKRFRSSAGLTASGAIMTAAGGAGTFMFALLSIIGIATTPVFNVGAVIGEALFIAGLGVSTWSLIAGIRRLQLGGRLKALRGIFGEREVCAMDELSRRMQLKPKALLATARTLISRGYLPEGRIDDESTTLMVTENAYHQYRQFQQTQRQTLAEREAAEAARAAEAAARAAHEKDISERLTPEQRAFVARGRDYVRQMDELNAAIDDAAVSERIMAIQDVVGRILARAEEEPAVIAGLDRLTAYYLPTTVKLLDAYDRLEEEPIQGENISSSRSEIEHTLEVLHSAFEKLFDDTYQDLSLDVSADISVLHAMLAQEGLTEGPFDVKP